MLLLQLLKTLLQTPRNPSSARAISLCWARPPHKSSECQDREPRKRNRAQQQPHFHVGEGSRPERKRCTAHCAITVSWSTWPSADKTEGTAPRNIKPWIHHVHFKQKMLRGQEGVQGRGRKLRVRKNDRGPIALEAGRGDSTTTVNPFIRALPAPGGSWLQRRT